MVLKWQPRAVVTGEDHVGILAELEFIESREQFSDLRIDVFDGVDVGFFRIGITHIVGHIQRDVRHGVRKIEEKRLGGMGFDEVDGALRVAASDGALIDRKLDDFFVFVERRAPLRERGFGIIPQRVHAIGPTLRSALVVGMVHVVRVRDAEVGVEALSSRQNFGMVAEVPLADAGRGVALGFEVIGDGVFIRMQALGRGRKKHMQMHADTFRIASSEQSGARGSAHRRGDEKIGEFSAFLREAIDVRRANGFRSKTTEVAIAHVIHKNHHHIRLRSGLGKCVESEKQRGKKEFFHG